MNPIASSIIAYSFLGLLCLTGACIILRFFFVSKRIRSNLEIGAVVSILGACAIFMFAPGGNKTTKPLAQVGSLEPGCYAIDEVWQVDNKACAMMRRATITKVDRTNQVVSHVYAQTDNWVLCNVTGLEIVGSPNPRKGHPFTGYALVERTNNKVRIRMYNPFD